MGRVKRAINHLLVALLFIQGLALIAIIGLEVFYRYVLGSALSWPEEVAGIIFVWFTLLGIVVLEGEGSHISFNIIDKFLPDILAKALRVSSHLIVITYGVVMIIYGLKYSLLFKYETSPAAGINLIWLNMSVPISGVLLIFFTLFNLVDTIKGEGETHHEEGGH